ncbi:MAG: TetR/AcrR family transcriptional regulator [Acidimicrobiia bacterium]
MSTTQTTPERLQQVALDLFEERGYDNVTVEQIATGAGVSHMTFFRHFPTKESVVVSDPYDPMIAHAVSAQPTDLSALQRVRRGLLEASAAMGDGIDAATRARIRIGVSHPRLRAAMWENNHETGRLLVSVLTGSGVPGFEARVAVGACLGSLMAALADWAEDEAGESLGRRIERALEILGPA